MFTLLASHKQISSILKSIKFKLSQLVALTLLDLLRLAFQIQIDHKLNLEMNFYCIYLQVNEPNYNKKNAI